MLWRMSEQLQLLIWESEVTRTGTGTVTLTARRPLSTMSCAHAAKLLGLGRDRVYDLYQAGLLDGYKPGAIAVRKDGRASNAAVRLDSASVLEYRERSLAASRAERER
jgi:hypothetical protein